MITLCRNVLLIAVAVATLVGLTAHPAQASFTAKVTASPVSVTTLDLTAPANPTARLDSCNNARWMDVTVGWTASTSRGVSGYLVRAYRSNGEVFTVTQTGGSASSVSTTVDKFNAGATSFTVTTLTSYGWTKESVNTVGITC